MTKIKRIESQKINEDYGPCCATGMPGADNLVFLPLKLPEGMPGWGCDVCQLPSKGAVAVITDEAKEKNLPIKHFICGDPLDKERMDVKKLNESFEHDQEAHLLFDHVTKSDHVIYPGDKNASKYGLVKGVLSGGIYLMEDSHVVAVHRLALHTNSSLPLDNMIQKLKDQGYEPWFIEPTKIVVSKLIERGWTKHYIKNITTWRQE